MDFKEILEKLSRLQHLTGEEAAWALNAIMTGEVSSEQVAGFLTAMTIKQETIEELTAFVQVMRSKAVKVNVDVVGAVDMVGTGGDKSGTFNISTAAAFVTAGAGVPMIKHGNRSASSKCGSADVLEELGASIELNNTQVEEVFKQVGMAFMFAPMFHPAMKYVMPARRALGFRTFFNILGPLSNPASVKRYVIGAFSKPVAEKMIQILGNLDTEFAHTFNAHDGLDEVSTTSDSEIFELGVAHSTVFKPESLGFQRASMNDLLGGDREENATILRNIMLNKATQAQKDIVMLNATFAIKASGKVSDLQEAKLLAEDSIASGKANDMLNSFIQATQDVKGSV